MQKIAPKGEISRPEVLIAYPPNIRDRRRFDDIAVEIGVSWERAY